MTARHRLAIKLRWLRFERSWSQEKLAEYAGLHPTYISSIERRAVNVSLDNLEKLAQAFGLPLGELWADPEPESVEAIFWARRRRRFERSSN